MSEGDGLPLGWTEAPLAISCEKIQDGTHFSPSQESQKTSGPYPYVTAKNVRPWGMDLDSLTYLEESEHRPIYKRCDTRKDDVLLVKDGVNAGDACVNAIDGEVSLLSSVCMIRPRVTLLDARFLRYYLLSPQAYRALTGQMTGTAIKRIILAKVRATESPIAPLPEQRRIVAKIEELFSHLDAGVQSLKRAKANLKRYRASVLKAAVEGRLTEEWRAANPQEEDGQMLLDRILRERREKWEQDQLAKFREKGKEPPKNWQSKYAEPAEPDVSELPELPEGWMWATIGGSTFVDVGYAFKSADFSTEGIRLLRGDNMEPGALRWQDARHWPEDKLPGFESLLLGVGDIVLAMDRPLISTGLKIARVRESDLPCLLVQRVARLRPMTDLTNSLLYIAMQTRRFIKHLQGEQQGTQIPHISGQTIAEFSIPVPPLAEQEQIVSLVEERLSQIDAAEKTINAELLRAKRLRQSILKQAFEGKLVPQDPNDEPASVLLERIKTARAAEPPTKRTKQSKKVTAK